ncbi:hypothetical protein DFH08DRAFT_802110 [Mycena albidolilacea]|uniref:Uncharacterized protein n=1 Tax=Mycena albidolilacea TaxID=1033008 RepID=A0AAD7AGQ6_9AGAR|nr:hypothetical protein DFH08DRAFT_802110 [Mycena albidolilacea]
MYTPPLNVPTRAQTSPVCGCAASCPDIPPLAAQSLTPISDPTSPLPPSLTEAGGGPHARRAHPEITRRARRGRTGSETLATSGGKQKETKEDGTAASSAPRLPLRGYDARAMPPLNGERGVLEYLIRDLGLGLPQRRTEAGGLGAVLSHPLASSGDAERTARCRRRRLPQRRRRTGSKPAAEQLVLGIPRRRMRLGTQRTGSGCDTPTSPLTRCSCTRSRRGTSVEAPDTPKPKPRTLHLSPSCVARASDARDGMVPRTYIVRRGPSPPPIRPASGTRELGARRVAQLGTMANVDVDGERNDTGRDSTDQKTTADAEMEGTASTSGEQNAAMRMRRCTAERHCTGQREVQRRTTAGGTRNKQAVSGCSGGNRGVRAAGSASLTVECKAGVSEWHDLEERRRMSAEPRSWVNPNLHLDPAVRGARADPLLTRLLPIGTSLDLFKWKHLRPIVHHSRLSRARSGVAHGSFHTSCRSGIDARDAPLELADSWQNTLEAARTLHTVNEVSPAKRCREGGAARGGVAVEAHDDPKAGSGSPGEVEVATTRMAERSRQRKAEGSGEWHWCRSRGYIDAKWGVSAQALAPV